MSKNRVEAVERALTLLECFTQERRTLSLTELAEATGMYKSTVLRLTGSLERFHFLIRRDDGRFAIGQAVWRLGLLYRNSFELESLVRPILAELVQHTGETASFYVKEGHARVVLYRENSTRAARHHLDEGVSLPLDSGASGHILRAYSDMATAELAAVREQGFAVSLGERDPDLAAIAVPVFGKGQALQGALTVSGIITRFTEPDREKILTELKLAAQKLHKQLLKTARHDGDART